MKRAVLFRYHTNFAVCRNRLALLRRLNPSLPIWGLYGGDPSSAPKKLDLDDHYVVPFSNPQYKWKHGDLCVRRWFKDRGHAFSFDMLHVIEWDLVLLQPVHEVFKHIKTGVAVSERKTLARWKQEQWYWLTNPKLIPQFEKFRLWLRAHKSFRIDLDTMCAGTFPGASASRAFLERYAADSPPLFVHDEIRMPAFAKLYGMPVHDTRLAKTNPLWHCEKNAHAPETLHALRVPPRGVHPLTEMLDIDNLAKKKVFAPR